MSQVINEVKLNKDYSFLSLDHFNTVEGELVAEIDNEISITLAFTADYDAEGYTDYDGEHAIELGGISNIELDMKQAWTINEDGDTIDEVTYEVGDSLIAELKGLIEIIYASTEPDFASIEHNYKEMMEGF